MYNGVDRKWIVAIQLQEFTVDESYLKSAEISVSERGERVPEIATLKDIASKYNLCLKNL